MTLIISYWWRSWHLTSDVCLWLVVSCARKFLFEQQPIRTLHEPPLGLRHQWRKNTEREWTEGSLSTRDNLRSQFPVSIFGISTFDCRISSHSSCCLCLCTLQNLFLLGATAIEDKLQEVSFYFSIWRNVGKNIGGGIGGKTRVIQITSPVIGWNQRGFSDWLNVTVLIV